MVQTIQQIIEVPLSFVFDGRCPLYAGRAFSQVLPWRRHSCSHSCSSLRICRPCFRLRKTAGFSAVAVLQRSSTPPVFVQMLIPMVQVALKTIEILQFVHTVVDVPVALVVHVLSDKVVDVPVVVQRQVLGLTVQKAVLVPLSLGCRRGEDC